MFTTFIYTTPIHTTSAHEGCLFVYCLDNITLYQPFSFLRYASRVKLITNDASKNSDNKEIARLKGVSFPL